MLADDEKTRFAAVLQSLFPGVDCDPAKVETALARAGFEITEPRTDPQRSLMRSDQRRSLQAVAKFQETGEWEGHFTYPGCGADLARAGLVNEDTTPTPAGQAALFLLGFTPTPQPQHKET